MGRPGRNDPCPCGSGKKYKRCCLGREPDAKKILPIAYHQTVFADDLTSLGSDVRSVADADAELLSRNFISLLAPPRVFSPQRSVEILELWEKSLEARMSEIICRHHVYYWLHVYRGLPPENVFGYRDIHSVDLIRNILESAFYKYGKIDRASLDDDMIFGENVDSRIVMSGEYVRSSEKYGLPVPPTSRGIFVRTFSINHFTEILSLDRMALSVPQRSRFTKTGIQGRKTSSSVNYPLQSQERPGNQFAD